MTKKHVEAFIEMVLTIIFLFFISLGCNSRSHNVIGNPPVTQQPVVNYIHVPAEYPAIQDAIDVAHSGDVVLVSDGYYPGGLVLRNGVTVIGNPTNTWIGGSIVARNLETSVFGLEVAEPTVDVSLDGAEVTFDHCTFHYGTCRVDRGSLAIMRNCTFDGGSFASDSAIKVISGFARVEKSIFEYYGGSALDTSLLLGVAAGKFENCLFYKNLVAITGTWSGTPTFGDPLHVDRSSGQYYLDNGSPGIISLGNYIGAWRPADFKNRPWINAMNNSPRNISSTASGLQTVLDFVVSTSGTGGLGASTSGVVNIQQLKFNVSTNVSTGTKNFDWLLTDGSTVLERFQVPIQPGEYQFWIPYSVIVQAGSPKTLQLRADLSFLSSGDHIEIELDAVRWNDGGQIGNYNGQNIGLPVRGPKLSVP